MAGSSLLALIDDITSVLDDVAVLTKTAAVKTTGVMGDDLALNAQQVSGVHVDRELPVVWAVAKGSFINKLILVPAALAISAFFPPAIMPLMLIGGLFLCYEGFEKVAHKLLHRDGEEAAHHQAHLQALTDPTVDVIAIEKEKIRGAIRTDFVLSAEIVVITLGTMTGEPMLQQVLALSAVAIAATVLVYGLVGGIVKLDDLGVALQARASAGARRIGGWILRAAPVMMKTLSFLGTAAMFTVGGSIIAHGIPAIEHLIHGIVEPVAARSGILGTIMTTLLDALVGLVAGGLAVALMAGVQRVRGGRSAVGLALIGTTTALAGCQPAASRSEPVSPARAASVPGEAAAQSLASATQLVIVTTGGWDSATGELRRFIRSSVDGPWRAEGSAEPVVVGRTGLAWGVGFDRSGPRKVEGDGRAPAGVFPFET
ncbi:MAG TPA: DUF808 domain-containing protein, partial [Gemmatimonadaceae bacterium]|nr:DUF808 domain-containing protein [Gemmatimonadaceae bacterium]